MDDSKLDYSDTDLSTQRVRFQIDASANATQAFIVDNFYLVLSMDRQYVIVKRTLNFDALIDIAAESIVRTIAGSAREKI